MQKNAFGPADQLNNPSISRLFVLLLTTTLAFSANADTLHVSTNGSDANNGEANSPFATITHASTQANFGDTVLIKAGIYSEHVIISTSGAPGVPVTYLGEDGAIIDGTGIIVSPVNSDEGDRKGLFQISGQSHIILDNVFVKNTTHHGINVNAGISTNVITDITIRNCRTENTDGSGIIAYGTYPFNKYQLNNILIENNEVITPQQGRFNGNVRWHEDITIGGGAENFTIRGNHVDARQTNEVHGGPLGIDAKDGVRNGRIYKNHVENIPSQGIYVDAGQAGASNIEIYQNRVHAIAGYGIIVGAEESAAADNIKIHNNIVYDTGYSAIRIADFVDANRTADPLQPKTNIHIFNNTIHNTGAEYGWAGGISASVQSSGRVFNNIINTDNPLAVAEGNYMVTNNCFNGDYSETGETGVNFSEGNPGFINAGNANFHLASASSPCIDSGIANGAWNFDYDGNSRPSGNGYDAGAFEYSGALPPATLVSPNSVATSSSPSFSWNAVPGSTWYQLYVWGHDGIFKQWYTRSSASCSGGSGVCSVNPAHTFSLGPHRWWVKTWNSSGAGPWSAAMDFTVGSGNPPPAATLISPSGGNATATPTYTWNAASGASWYYLWVNDVSGNVIKRWYTASQVGCAAGSGTCSVQHATPVVGASRWWIRTWNNAGIGPWSAGSTFTP
ncbi:MAG: choice-of-anchor Q domain-containing protein [Granulosicoccus sp.]